jgi:hypothetical protein
MRRRTHETVTRCSVPCFSGSATYMVGLGDTLVVHDKADDEVIAESLGQVAQSAEIVRAHRRSSHLASSATCVKGWRLGS